MKVVEASKICYVLRVLIALNNVCKNKSVMIQSTSPECYTEFE